MNNAEETTDLSSLMAVVYVQKAMFIIFPGPRTEHTMAALVGQHLVVVLKGKPIQAFQFLFSTQNFTFCALLVSEGCEPCFLACQYW